MEVKISKSKGLVKEKTDRGGQTMEARFQKQK